MLPCNYIIDYSIISGIFAVVSCMLYVLHALFVSSNNNFLHGNVKVLFAKSIEFDFHNNQLWFHLKCKALKGKESKKEYREIVLLWPFYVERKRHPFYGLSGSYTSLCCVCFSVCLSLFVVRKVPGFQHTQLFLDWSLTCTIAATWQTLKKVYMIIWDLFWRISGKLYSKARI